ncbi:phospholipase D family protein [Mesorhizobium sp. B1-1-8]|uniref:phospholipase D family protein n=1 Tax=Mesorhizobium sp. B1-1-8 TaxID=2589976 RepID=UPI00112D0858|nr:phospholipase D family protein [Mesorhizobium sp. B1-1-8]UCI07327.1 phospholipase D family protein [Mesorhizobium sp. B1-1-8]
MRRDGDLLVSHLERATTSVLLCAPFIKLGVAKRLLAAISPNVAVEIVTRWHAEEVAAGVSDLAVFDLAVSRPGVTMRLLDNLHAKLYASDHSLLAGSANLTATALGWCDDPNLELLIAVRPDDEAVVRCRLALSAARLATAGERAAIQAVVDGFQRPLLPAGKPVDEALAELWLPKLAAPERLYAAYLPSARERLTSSSIEAADHDLRALAIEPNLNEAAFRARVAERFSTMPAVSTVLTAAQDDLSDAAATELVQTLVGTSDMSAIARWQIVREWLTYFLREKYEIAPQSYITRPRPGTGRE